MSDDGRQFILAAMSQYDQRVQQHSLFREQSIAVLAALDGASLTFLFGVDDFALRAVGCLFVVAITALIWFIGEKNLAMVIYYRACWLRTAANCWPDVQASLIADEKAIADALTGEADVDGVEKLRGLLGTAFRCPSGRSGDGSFCS